MNRYSTYFGQVVTDAELNEIFDSFANSIEEFIQDFGYSGVAVGADVAQNTSPNLSVLVAAPSVVYDQYGRRIAFASQVSVDVTVDEVNQPTAVVNSGNEKWLSLFVAFKEVLSDPRTDELGDEVFFRRNASYQFFLAQGAEAPIGTAVRPALRGTAILLADIRLTNGLAAVLAGNINTARTQFIYAIPGTPVSLQGKSLKQALPVLVAAINTALGGITSATIAMPAIVGSPTSLASGTVLSVITALLVAVNNIATQVTSSIANVAYKNQANAFTAANDFTAGSAEFAAVGFSDQLFMKVTSPTRALRATNIEPAANNWKIIDEFASVGGDVRAYTSTRAGSIFAIVVNAHWTGTVWARDDTDQGVVALLWMNKYLRVSTKPSGTDTWADWDAALPSGVGGTDRGIHVIGELIASGGLRVGKSIIGGVAFEDKVTIGGNVEAGKDLVSLGGDLDVYANMTSHHGSLFLEEGGIQIAGQISAGVSPPNAGAHGTFGGNVVAKGYVHSDHDSRAVLEFRYQPTKARAQQINLQTGVAMNANLVDVGDSWICLSGYGTTDGGTTWGFLPGYPLWTCRKPGTVGFPISLPDRATLKRVLATFNQLGGVAELKFALRVGTTMYGNHGNGEPLYDVGEHSDVLVMDGPTGGISTDGSPVTLFVTCLDFTFAGESLSGCPFIKEINIEWTDAGPSGMRS